MMSHFSLPSRRSKSLRGYFLEVIGAIQGLLPSENALSCFPTEKHGQTPKLTHNFKAQGHKLAYTDITKCSNVLSALKKGAILELRDSNANILTWLSTFEILHSQFKRGITQSFIKLQPSWNPPHCPPSSHHRPASSSTLPLAPSPPYAKATYV